METTTRTEPAGDTAAAVPEELPVYRAGEVPEPLATMTQLKARRLKPAKGQEVKGLLRMYRRGQGWGVFDLYDPADAEPMRPLSAKQQAAMTARRTCPECGTVRDYVVHTRCGECRRKADEEAQDRRNRTCSACHRVSAGPLRWTGHGVPAAPRCVPCWFAVALKVRAREEESARWARSCPECKAQTATDEEVAQALAERGSWTPRCCAPCAVVREERRVAAERQFREAAEEAAQAREREVSGLEVWARGVLEDGRAVVLDTETTGLDDDARIVEISVLEVVSGTVLLDTLVSPGCPIGEASEIHGITDEMVAGAPTFSQVLPQLSGVLAGRRCLIYNRAYDVARLRYEVTLHHQAADCGDPVQAAAGWIGEHTFEDAMVPYSDWVGDWSDYWGNNCWQPLDGGHRALGDCRAVVARLKEMAAGHRGRSAEDTDADPWAAGTLPAGAGWASGMS